jgi:stringent starvation protein B
MPNDQAVTSTRPYLIRALYEWCTDNGLTPYVAVKVDDSVRVPREYVKNDEIVLNISFDATSSLKLGNEFIEFKARFAGVARDIQVPIRRVIAIYARESGQGMAFPLEPDNASQNAAESSGEVQFPIAGSHIGKHLESVAQKEVTDSDKPDPAPPNGGGSRPSLRRIK